MAVVMQVFANINKTVFYCCTNLCTATVSERELDLLSQHLLHDRSKYIFLTQVLSGQAEILKEILH